MRLTVLGSGSCVPSLKRGAAGYLVRTAKKNILVDMGLGTIHKLLQREITYADIDVLCFTHTHPDHVSELVPFLFACKYGEVKREKDLVILGGEGFQGFFESLLNVFHDWLRSDDFTVEVRELVNASFDDDGTEIEIALARATVLEQRGELEQAVAILEKSLNADGTLAIDGIGIQFMLGQIYDSLNRFDDAFEMYRLGNKHRLEAFPDFGEKVELGHSLRRLIDVTSPEHFRRCPTSGLDTNRPIFIVGMPRSGTSLMEQILSNHPSVFGAGELSELGDEIRDTYQSDRAGGALEIVADDPSGDFGCLIPRDWENITQERLRDIAERYLNAIEKLSPDAERVTDKMPFNYMMAGVIHKLFPNATIIHTRRDPIDTCLSCFFQNFTAGSQFAFDLEQVGLYYRCYENLMLHWRDTLSVPILEVDYEDVVQDPEPNVRRVLEHCGLEWNGNCLNTHKSKRVVRTASYQQVRKPIYKRSAGRWKNYERHLGPLFKGLGIDPNSQ